MLRKNIRFLSSSLKYRNFDYKTTIPSDIEPQIRAATVTVQALEVAQALQLAQVQKVVWAADYKTSIPIDIEAPINLRLVKDQKNKPLIDQYFGSICKECFGSGWKIDRRCKFNYICNFKFNICKKCNGTGYI